MMEIPIVFFIDNSPKKIDIECEETNHIDRISQLPNAIIVQILSRLPPTDAFRITILSKHCK